MSQCDKAMHKLCFNTKNTCPGNSLQAHHPSKYFICVVCSDFAKEAGERLQYT